MMPSTSSTCGGPSAALEDARAGVLAVLPVVVAAAPFALLLGALALGKGLSPAEIVLMSATVFAGGAQFVALDLWTSPPAVALLAGAALLVNLRHVLMGASLAPKLGAFPPAARPFAMLVLTDEAWALSERRAARGRLTPAFYFALSLTLYVAWIALTALGTLVGGLIADPARYGFDFAFVAIFIGLLAGFRAAPRFGLTVAASAAAACAVHLAAPGPWTIAVGAVAGVAAAALVPARAGRAA